MPEKPREHAVKTVLSAHDRAVRCAELAYDKKAFDIRAYDISVVSTIADCLVIISGNSEKQNQAIALFMTATKLCKPLEVLKLDTSSN